MDKIKVLWMNNGEESSNTFTIEAIANNMIVETCQNIAECTEILSTQKNKWQVLILNIDYEVKEGRLKGNRKINRIDIDFIKEQIGDLPFYFVTDSEKLSQSAKTYVKIIKKEVFYLQKEAKLLLQKIQSDSRKLITNRYEKICQFCQCPILNELLEVLEFPDKKQPIETNSKIPNQVRMVLDWLQKDSSLFKGREIPNYIKEKMKNERDFKDGSPVEKQPLNIFSKILGHSTAVPVYVKRSSYACTSTNQEGSHYTEITKTIIAGAAPYVTRSLIYELLNILYWCASLNENTFEL